ncbi:TPA: hypothetical protein ACGGS3_000626 [Vibrio cholerae]
MACVIGSIFRFCITDNELRPERMNAIYYKSTSDEPVNALASYREQKESYARLFDPLTNHFNAKAIFTYSHHGVSFYSIAFNDYESLEDKDLWTKPDFRSACACRVRSSVKGKDNSQRLKALKEKYDSLIPKDAESPSLHPFYDSIGTNWGDLVFSGMKWFEYDGAVYIATSLKLTKNVIEITGSEFSTAELESKQKSE